MLLVAMRLGDTPVPIPNTVWESRWLPELKKEYTIYLLYHIERTRLSPQKDGHLADRDGRVNLHQRGSAVMITGFTSDLRPK